MRSGAVPRTRWYDPQTGRFLSPDVASSGLAMGTSSMVRSMVMSEPCWVHPYSLGRGNPMVWIDNDGKLLLSIGVGALGGLLSCIANEFFEEVAPSQVHTAEDCLCQIGGGAIAGMFPLGFLGGLAGGGIGNALTELCRCGSLDLNAAGQGGFGGILAGALGRFAKGLGGDAAVAAFLSRLGMGSAAGGITSPCCKK